MTQSECTQAINDAAETCIHQMIDIEISIPAEAYNKAVRECVEKWGSRGGVFGKCASHILLWPRGQVKSWANKVQINLGGSK